MLVLFALLAIALGRYELAREQVIGAARDAAEAASVVPSAAQAESAAGIQLHPQRSRDWVTRALISVSRQTQASSFLVARSV